MKLWSYHPLIKYSLPEYLPLFHQPGTSALIQALVSNQISALLVQNLDRLNESIREESDGIHNTLSIVENLVEFRPEVCKEVADAGLLTWLMKKLKVKVPFDNNKLYASEILSILLQNEPDNRKGNTSKIT